MSVRDEYQSSKLNLKFNILDQVNQHEQIKSNKEEIL